MTGMSMFGKMSVGVREPVVPALHQGGRGIGRVRYGLVVSHAIVATAVSASRTAERIDPPFEVMGACPLPIERPESRQRVSSFFLGVPGTLRWFALRR